MSASDSKLPLLASLMLIIVSLLIGLISGFSTGSIASAVVAVLAIVPACYGMWLGIQDKESQTTMLWSILLFLTAVGIAGLMILLRFVDWLR